MNSIRLFGAVLTGEVLKLRRTLALRLTVTAPAVVALLAIYQVAFDKTMPMPNNNPWPWLSTAMITVWTIVPLPLLVGLLAALVHAPEHEGRHWKQLLVQPVPPVFLYLAKLAVVAALTALSTLFLWAETLAFEAAFTALHWRGITAWPSIRTPFLPDLPLSLAAALLIVALHHWLSSYWEGFTVPLGITMSGFLVALITHHSHTAGKWLPWALPANAALRPDVRPYALSVGVIGFVLVTVLGCREFSQREFPH